MEKNRKAGLEKAFPCGRKLPNKKIRYQNKNKNKREFQVSIIASLFRFFSTQKCGNVVI
jgi:hypothetical protein